MVKKRIGREVRRMGEEKTANINANVTVKAEEALRQAEELVSLLKTASSLAGKLAVSLDKLEFDIKF